MSNLESASLNRNRYFDDLSATPGLYWLGQNTNHIESHPAVREAMLRSIEAGEFNAYAPPLGFEALRSAIVTDLGTPDAEALVTEGGVNALAMICRARCKPGTTLVTTDPTWKWPCLFARQQGAEVIEIPIYDPACNYRLTAEALKAHVDERTAIIYLVDPNNPLGIRYSREEIEGLALPIFPSHGNFLVLETIAAGIRPEALVECFRRQGIMIRQGTYHTQRFGDRFVKVSTSVPSSWVEKFCTLLPEMVAQARTLNDLPPQF